ncbi:MAG: hypothetical protein GC157_02080 [Frankiales bacterium]|nr:hypothetical protein [Frankiales bacterium]
MDASGTRTAGRPALADLCRRDPLDLDSDPRLCRAGAVVVPEPCGPLCTPWCLAGHGGPATDDR